MAALAGGTLDDDDNVEVVVDGVVALVEVMVEGIGVVALVEVMVEGVGVVESVELVK